jgi:peptidase M28-like protein
VRERTFEFSEMPGRFATPLTGAAGALLVGAAGQLAAAGERYAPIAVMTLGAVALLASSSWLAARGVLTVPVLRAHGVNLEATRAGVIPSLWLCAHLDSKSQPIPTLLRSIGIVLEAIGVLLTMAWCVAIAFGVTIHAFFWTFAAALTLLGAIPVVLSMVGAESPGALDNASGVATMIAASRQIGQDPRVGVLITDGEELGLAGAREWARHDRPAGTTVLNSDGVDDAGEVQVMYAGRAPSHVLAALGRAARESKVRCQVGRLVPGLLTDSVAFAARGMASVTFSRGTWRSLARVHSRRDDVAHLRGTGVAEVAALVAATTRQLLTRSSDDDQWKRSSSA